MSKKYVNCFLETQHCSIYVPEEKDIPYWHQLHSNIDVMKFLGGIRSLETTTEWLNSDIASYIKHGFCLGSVFKKENNEFIGRAGLVHPFYDDRLPELEIGYSLLPQHWRKGYGKELVTALISWAFNGLNKTQLVAFTRPNNLNSIKLLEAVGLVNSGMVVVEDKRLIKFSLSRKDDKR